MEQESFINILHSIKKESRTTEFLFILYKSISVYTFGINIAFYFTLGHEIVQMGYCLSHRKPSLAYGKFFPISASHLPFHICRYLIGCRTGNCLQPFPYPQVLPYGVPKADLSCCIRLFPLYSYAQAER